MIFALVLLSLLAVFDPEQFFLAGAACVLLAVGAAGYFFPWTCFGLAVGSLILSPENFLQFSIGGVELRSLHRALILAAFCATVLRHGLARPFNAPVVAVALTFFTSFTLSDLHPKLDAFQIIKSTFAFVVLFLFINVNYSPEVIPRYLRIIGFLPIVSVFGGVLAQAAHLDSPWGPWEVLPTEWTGAPRLNGLNISSYLAYFAFVAIFANIYELLETRKKWLLGLAGINLIIIILTGTRTPMAAAMFLAVVMLLFSGGRTLNISAKVNLSIVGLLVIGGVIVLWWPAIETRLLRSFGDDGIYMSGRDVIWDYFLRAFWENPWFGRGLGTGAVLLVGELNVTTAAHNEYLRLLTDVGIVGLVLFICGFAWWIRDGLRFMYRDERLLILGFVVALALYSLTDNTLSSPPALMAMFALSLVFARGRHRYIAAMLAHRHWPRPGTATSRGAQAHPLLRSRGRGGQPELPA